MARTQEERRAETRRLLLEAAADLFARKGFHATSAEAVADAAHRTTGALYDHFGGKEGLLVALVQRWVDEAFVVLGASIEAEPDLGGRLGALWDGLIRHDAESGDAWLLLEFELWLHAARDPELGLVGAQRFQLIRDALAESFDQWSAELGAPLAGPADQLAAQAIALLLGAAYQHRLDPAAMPRAVVVAGLQRLLGLPGRPTPDRRTVGRRPKEQP